jgi:phytoene dehydrogenase-like protein
MAAGSKTGVVVGAGPNGLAAAITLARAGCRVTVLEASDHIGGGARTEELTLPGYRHDLCSTVHPLAVLSPVFRSLPLERFGLQWIAPPLPLAHPLDDGTAAVLHRSLHRTAEELGADGAAYRHCIGSVVADWERIAATVLGPPTLMPPRPFAAARFARRALRPAAAIAGRFRQPATRALWAGLAAHAMIPLEWRPSAAYGLVLAAAAHLGGWPIPRGGAQAISDAMAAYLRTLGGDIQLGVRIRDGRDLPPADVVVTTTTPRQMAHWTQFPTRTRRRLASWPLGPGVCKLDWALREPIPWTAVDCAQAGTVHVGGGWEEIAAAERAPWRGGPAASRSASPPPFVLVTQPTQFDPSRAPAGGHIAWGYCHVPNGSSADMTEAIEAQIERFAPGFRRRILARHAIVAAEMAGHNPNYTGGDIAGGAQDLAGLLRRMRHGYRTGNRRIFNGSAAAAPGAGVHGLSGHYAALAALRSLGLRGGNHLHAGGRVEAE